MDKLKKLIELSEKEARLLDEVIGLSNAVKDGIEKESKHNFVRLSYQHKSSYLREHELSLILPVLESVIESRAREAAPLAKALKCAEELISVPANS